MIDIRIYIYVGTRVDSFKTMIVILCIDTMHSNNNNNNIKLVMFLKIYHLFKRTNTFEVRIDCALHIACRLMLYFVIHDLYAEEMPLG